MPLQIQSFDTIVQNQATAIKASTAELVDFDPGSILLALIQANAANSLWLQSLISSLLAVTRLQTSTGSDVDTFVNAFGYTRKAGTEAQGTVTFSRTITTSISYIPATTTIVAASLSGVQFITLADTTNPYYNVTTNQYEVPIGLASINVGVKCLTVGVSGNVLAGQINTLVNPPENINTVTNALNFTSGTSQATDAEVKAGFILYLATLSKATLAAIRAAALSVSGVKKANVVENKTTGGATQLGYFYVVVDNGTGTASGDLLASVHSAVELARGLTIQYDVIAVLPTAITSITMSLIVDTTDVQARATITSNIKAAVAAYVASLPIGSPAGTLYYTRVIQLIYDSSSHIIDVSTSPALMINGATADITVDGQHVITLNPAVITVNYL